jgi:hypothetical protein
VVYVKIKNIYDKFIPTDINDTSVNAIIDLKSNVKKKYNDESISCFKRLHVMIENNENGNNETTTRLTTDLIDIINKITTVIHDEGVSPMKC